MSRLLSILLLLALCGLAAQPVPAQEEAAGPVQQSEADSQDAGAEAAGETNEYKAELSAEEQAQLDELEEQARAVLTVPPPQPLPDSSATLKEILARPEFAREAEKLNQGPSLLERFLNWLSGLINIQPGSNSAWLISLTIVLSLLVIYLMVRLTWEMLARRKSGSSAKGDAVLGFESGFEALLAAAKRSLSASDYRNALRYRYLASLSRLDLPASALLTNSQILRLMRKRHPGIGGSLGQLVQRFEDVWYGGADCSVADYNVVDSLALEIEDVAASGRES